MNKEERVYVAGHHGMVGSAIVRLLKGKGFENIITRTSKELDLRETKAVLDFFHTERPDYIFLAAAKVGGIMANNIYKAEFLYDNLMIQNNVINSSYLTKAKKLLFLGSSCIYPKLAPQPLQEKYLLTGLLEPTNESYAIAKIAGIKLCDAYRHQYGCNFSSVMPTNLYGPNDNYDLQNSHVLPAMIRKFFLAHKLEQNALETIATNLTKDGYDLRGEVEILKLLQSFGIHKISGEVVVKLWGSGTPFREFMHVDDMAAASIYCMENFSDYGPINVGTASEVTIKGLADKVKELISFSGKIMWDTTKPDGTPRKLMDNTMLSELGWKSSITLDEGLSRTIEEYLNEN